MTEANNRISEKAAWKEPSFKGVYVFISLFVVGVLAVCVFSSLEAKKIETVSAGTPAVKTYRNCEYLGEHSHLTSRYSFSDSISTSCGEFRNPKKNYELEKGKTYDIAVNVSKSGFKSVKNIIPTSGIDIIPPVNPV